ncbi:MAG: hypothetical protein ACI94Y_003581 [Maribacter sp.]|jgi:hypothetical protein
MWDQQIMKDEKLQKILQEEGVVSFPLLSEDEIKFLSDYFVEKHPDKSAPLYHHGFYNCIFSSDYQFKSEIHQTVKKILEPKIMEIIQNFRSLLYVMQLKGTGPNTELGIHQDWSVTDPDQHRTYTLWIPLLDTTADNGGMYVFKKSHLMTHNYRGGNIDSPYAKVYDLAMKNMEPYFVKAGTAVLIDQALLHYTPPNITENYRISLLTVLTPKDEKAHLYYVNNNGQTQQLEKYEQHDLFMLDYDDFLTEKSLKPKGKLVKTIKDFEVKHFTPESFNERLNQIKGIKKRGFLHNLFHRLKS